MLFMKDTPEDRNYKILLVDDDSQLLKTTNDLLKDKGYQVTTTGCGENAVEALEKDDFDLIITDLIMGKVSGIGVLKKAKELNPGRAVIIITGSLDVRHAIKAIRLKVDDYLLKPDSVSELIKRLNHCLKKDTCRRNNSLTAA